MEPPPASIEWPSHGVARAHADRIQRLTWSDTNWSAKCPADLAPTYGEVGIPPDVTWSIRNVWIKQKIVLRHTTIQKNRPAIMAEYDSSDICEMARRWNYPPSYLLRAILVWKGQLTARQITGLFTTGDTSPLGDYDKRQYVAAAACDAAPSDLIVAAAAQEREDQFVALFSGFPHKTQLELALEQTALHGRPVTTPDILFTPPITINGKSVAWIDYKAYAGVPDTYIARKIKAQVGRYKREYGDGAIVFRYGYVQGMQRAAGALCLDEQTCPLVTPVDRQ